VSSASGSYRTPHSPFPTPTMPPQRTRHQQNWCRHCKQTFTTPGGLRRHTAHSQQCYAQWELDAHAEQVIESVDNSSAPVRRVSMEPGSADDDGSALERDGSMEPTPHCVEEGYNMNVSYGAGQMEDTNNGVQEVRGGKPQFPRLPRSFPCMLWLTFWRPMRSLSIR
jgi:hypothetical protein